jgi:hypothetical protein
MNKQNYKLEIQMLDSQIEDLRENVNGSLSNQAEPAVCASPQTSSVMDVGQPIDSAGNCRLNGGVRVGRVKRDNRDKKSHQGNPPRDPQTNESQRSFFSQSGETQ